MNEENHKFQEGFIYLVERYGRPAECRIERVTFSAYKVEWLMPKGLLAEWFDHSEFEQNYLIIECLGMDESFLPKGFSALYHETLRQYDATQLSADVLEAMPEAVAKAMKEASLYFPKTIPNATAE